MNSDRKRYEMIGGSLDGQVQEIGGSLYPSMQCPDTSIPGLRREIYVLHHDGTFHFERFGLEPNPELHRLEVMEELFPIHKNLAVHFQEMDAVLEKHRGPDAKDA